MSLDHQKSLHPAIYLPAEIAAQPPLAFHPRLRVEGEINDLPLFGTFIPSSQGHRLIPGSARLKLRGLKNQIGRFCQVPPLGRHGDASARLDGAGVGHALAPLG